MSAPDVDAEYTFVVPGKPAVKQRPRLGRGRRAYTPMATHLAEQHVAACYMGPMFEGPVFVEISLRGDHTEVTVGSALNASKLRGDIDNYLKLVLDGLNGVAYADDRQVVDATVVKL